MNNIQIGQVIGGRYRVDASLGKGGMAEVYKVWDQERAVFLALKLLRDDLAEDKTFLRRFQREGQVLAALQHPHIVRFYGLERDEDLAYILMDYVDGTTLRKEIYRANGPIALGRVIDVATPVCSALFYAHKQNLIHCDVKPANIMLHNNGSILLADFGIARVSENATTVTMVGAGTPAYMAPEQVMGANPMPQTDIYAFGVVLYEMVTGGDRPFTGDQSTVTGSTMEKVRWEQVNLAPAAPRNFYPDLPPMVEGVIMKCLEKDPARRYTNTMELLTALEQACTATMRVSRPTQPPQSIPAYSPSQPIPVYPPAQPPQLGSAYSPSQSIPVYSPAQPSQPGSAYLPSQPIPVYPPAQPPQLGSTYPPSQPPQPVPAYPAPVKGHKRSTLLWVMAVGMLVVILLAVFVFLKPTVVPPAIPITPMSSLPALTQVGPTQTLAGVVAATATPEPTLTPSLTPSVTPSVTPTQKPTVIPTIPPGMVSISAGSFKMGGNQQDAEKPIHLVTLNGFWIDKYEVTNDGYAQCVAAKKCQVPTTRSSSTRADYYGNKQYSSYPVLYVSWSDAKAYCEWRGARLPTEAEWEKAARGGLDGKLYPWGDTLPSCTPGSANGAQSESCAVKDTAPVGSFASNGYGLFDMAGNVWEWVSDWYDAGYYSSSPANNPTGPANGELKGVRGNGWYFGLNALRVANRGSIDPASRTAYIGFRCAVSAP